MTMLMVRTGSKIKGFQNYSGDSRRFHKVPGNSWSFGLQRFWRFILTIHLKLTITFNIPTLRLLNITKVMARILEKFWVFQWIVEIFDNFRNPGTFFFPGHPLFCLKDGTYIILFVNFNFRS